MLHHETLEFQQSERDKFNTETRIEMRAYLKLTYDKYLEFKREMEHYNAIFYMDKNNMEVKNPFIDDTYKLSQEAESKFEAFRNYQMGYPVFTK